MMSQKTQAAPISPFGGQDDLKAAISALKCNKTIDEMHMAFILFFILLVWKTFSQNIKEGKYTQFFDC